ncbi:MAG: hypothetical protein CVT49_00395 [candidate division Zixibacteria bacterium HGW-Zixibacteria-1]|nr:MAG: hypothetical protein CVT49_00395 [candidate division Zixibacteria bacterium HGW-Zixibacteria-1]
MRRLAIYILCLFITALSAAAANDGGTRSPFSLGAGARDLAQGGANIAFGDAATAPYWNTSRLAMAEQIAITGFHSRLYDSDVAYQYFGAVVPTLDWGCIGLGIFRLGVSGIEQRDADNVLIPGELQDNRMAFYLSYGKDFSGYDVGLAVSFEHHSLGTYSATSSPGLNLSLGRTFAFHSDHIRELSLALVGRNLIKPGKELASDRVEQPSAFDAGFSLKVKPAAPWDHNLTLSAVYTRVDYLDSKYAAGIEYSFHDLVSLRGGVRDGNLSAGGGLSYKSITFDYALVDRDMGSLHMFAISTAFGTPLNSKRKIRAETREAEFNSLMNNRLVSKNRDMVTDLMQKGRQYLDNGNLNEAVNHLDRALFLARNAGIDTTGLFELALESHKRLEEVIVRQEYGQYMDSAQARFDIRDYLAARYFAGLALDKFPNSNEARSLLESADAAIESNTSREEMIVGRLMMVDSLLSYGRVENALKVVNTLKEYAPDDNRVKLAIRKTEFEFYKEKATTAFAAGNLRLADGAVDTALTFFPGHQWCTNMKARIQQEVKRRAAPIDTPTVPVIKETISDEVLKEVRESYETAQRLFAKGSLSEAIEYWEKVDRLAPDYQSVRQYLVKAYKYVGVELYGRNLLRDAVDTWKKASLLDPGNNEINDYIKRTENEIRRLEELSYEHESK